MKIGPWFLCTLPLLGVSASAQPPALTSLYEGVRLAIETEDIEAVLAQLAPLMRLQASAQAGWLQELGAIFAQREGLAVEMRFDEEQIVGQKALVVVTWALSGRTTETGEAWSETQQRVDLLVQKGAHWTLLSSDRLAPDASASPLVEGRFADAESGLECAPPEGWRSFVTEAGRVALTAWSPDLEASITWSATDLPGAFTAEQLVRAQQDAEVRLAPSLGVEFRDPLLEPATLGERPAFRLRRTVVAADGLELLTEATYCLVGSTLYTCECTAMPPKALETHEAALDLAVASTRLIDTQPAALPPEAGRVEGNRYVNETVGCEITAPPGWTTKIGQSDFELQVTMYEPQGDSSLSLGMVRLPDPTVTAEMAILGDDGVSEQAFDGYELIKRGDTALGDLPAYESVTAFTLGGQRRQRHRVYLVDGDRLFFLFADAAPAEKWGNLTQLFTDAFQSFKLTEPKPPG